MKVCMIVLVMYFYIVCVSLCALSINHSPYQLIILYLSMILVQILSLFRGLVSTRGLGDMNVGTMLLFHPLIDEPNYLLYDQPYRERCCDPSLNSGRFCDQYFKERPIGDSEGYWAPSVGMFNNSTTLNGLCSSG